MTLACQQIDEKIRRNRCITQRQMSSEFGVSIWPVNMTVQKLSYHWLCSKVGSKVADEEDEERPDDRNLSGIFCAVLAWKWAANASLFTLQYRFSSQWFFFQFKHLKQHSLQY